jgi:hypothetical protein
MLGRAKVPCKNPRVMAKVIKFPKPNLRAKAEGKTLCKNGFHKWEIATERTFDVKRGKLVTVQRCTRCGIQETKLT